ncbi:hypothetical protein AFCDBAGC_5059 [Methylobacterium cerastii]|uniref:Uncharacterized protein n=1 Tax=Methylobacterium cerastii TaxID=932741 RepID=A0ABQ4QPF3_9HYPH|nr:hypothetical protein [Methylobacterium cerastii]GJD47173.1 hypothetical protein AFCDBAGC_5059 [Methylobacterium cerastii]
MAKHAHSTRTPLLPQAGTPSALLRFRAGKQRGPVTLALRAMRKADPDQAAHDAIEAIQQGLDRFFSDADHQRLKALRQRIANRIEFDLALLDALDGDADREDGADGEPSLGSIDATSHNDCLSQLQWSVGGVSDREMGNDNGIADAHGEAEQAGRHIALRGDCNVSWRRFA